MKKSVGFMSENVLLMFFSKSFMVSCLIFRGGHGNQRQYSCLENPMDGGAWLATVHGVAKNLTRPSDFTIYLLSLKV